MTRHTSGTDPEFFLRRKKDGKLISAIPHIKGTKHEPEKMACGSSLQYDNVAVEFATPVSETGDDMVSQIRNAFAEISKKIPKDCELVVEPSGRFEADQLEHKDAKAFGCDPDFCAWGLVQNEKPVLSDESFRSCGGHIHVGHKEGDGNEFLMDFTGKVDTVRLMDLFHGVTSTILDCSEGAIERRKLYGKAGCHRPTNYGVEYRVLSNFWFKSPQLVMLMDSLTCDVLEVMRAKQHDELIEAVGADVIQAVINKGDAKKAKKIINSVVSHKMSAQSIDFFGECSSKIKDYNFNIEWKIMEA